MTKEELTAGLEIDPTQEQLASIAASLPNGNAPDRVQLAVEIWEEARETLLGRRCLRLLPKRTGEATTIPLDQMLREAMPKASLADRMKAFRDFLTEGVRGVRYGVELLPTFREDGISGSVEAHFEWWRKEKRSARAAKGWAAKAAKRAESDASRGKKRANAKKKLGEEKPPKNRIKQRSTPDKQSRAPDK